MISIGKKNKKQNTSENIPVTHMKVGDTLNIPLISLLHADKNVLVLTC